MTTIARPNMVFIDTNLALRFYCRAKSSEDGACPIRHSDSIHDYRQHTGHQRGVCTIELIKRVNNTEEQARAIISDFYRRYIVMELDQPILLMASALREQYRLSYWDSFIVACALTGGASTLYSEDMHDGLIIHSQLTIVNPFKSISVPEN